MTEKRFYNEDNCCGYYTEIVDNEKELDSSLPNPRKNLTIEELVDLLNEYDTKYNQLKKDYEEAYTDLNNQELQEYQEKILMLIEDKISFLYKAKADMINDDDDYRLGQISFGIQCLRELKKEVKL